MARICDVDRKTYCIPKLYAPYILPLGEMGMEDMSERSFENV